MKVEEYTDKIDRLRQIHQSVDSVSRLDYLKHAAEKFSESIKREDYDESFSYAFLMGSACEALKPKGLGAYLNDWNELCMKYRIKFFDESAKELKSRSRKE